MSPRAAARRFVKTTLTNTLGDVLNLAEQDERAFTRVERAVRLALNMPERDLAQLADALFKTLSESHQPHLRAAFLAYDNAISNELTVREQTCYVVGVEIGRGLR